MHDSAMQSLDTPARRLLACLGDPSRFRVAVTLYGGECCVGDLAVRIGLSQSCTTRHLQVLEREGLVRGVRSGKRVFYRLRLEEPSVRGLIQWALQSTPRSVDHDLREADSRRSEAGVPGGGTGTTAASGPGTTGDEGVELESSQAASGEGRSAADIEDFLL